MTDDHGATVNEWVNIVRRARLDRTTKLVALTLASYANPDGTKVYPGLARLAVQCRADYRTVQRAITKLTAAGLIERVQRGNRRRGQADKYRLILAADLLERVDLPDPDEERADILAIKDRDRRQHHRTPVTGKAPDYRTEFRGLPDTGDTPPSIGPLPKTKPSIHSAEKSSGSTAVDRDDSAHAGPTGVGRHLALGNGWKKNSDNYDKPWADIQQRYDNEELDEFGVIDLIGLAVGWELDTVDQSTVVGMLGNGAHVKAIRNTIAKRGAA